MTAPKINVESDAPASAGSYVRERDFTELLVHDLRSPLTGLAGCVQLIRDELPPTTPASTYDYLDLCEAFVDKLSSRMDALLDATRIVEGAIAVKWSEHLIEAVVHDATNIIVVDLNLLEAKLVHRIPTGACAQFDRMLVMRVLENLLANASRYVGRGGHIEIVADTRDDDLVVTVSNDGKGIPHEIRGQIFDRYFRIEERLNATRVNRGLGLHFCRLAARAHGGDLTLLSAEDGDVRFELRIPQREQDRPAI